MKLNKIWGYGQLFGYSAIDGKNRFKNDFIGTLTSRKVEIRFELKKWVKIYFPLEEIELEAIMSDFIEGKNFFITFHSNDTLVGYSPVLPIFSGEKKLIHTKKNDLDIYFLNGNSFIMASKYENGLYKFVIHHTTLLKRVDININELLKLDLNELKDKRYSYYESMPKCKNSKYEELYYKALSVNKVNIKSPEGKIKSIWTTPNRVPHRSMWLWDSVFHALAMVNYNEEVAKDAINVVISTQRQDGFIPHMANPIKHSTVTQPQVLSWGVYEVYKKTKDIEFLKKNVDALDKYLRWDMKNRDKNGNGLLEWKTNPRNKKCKCGESGLDNSPRFDFDYGMDAIDFSTFQARDALYLSYIYKELGNEVKNNEWYDYYLSMKDKINSLLWDEETGAYYDRLFNGKLTKVLTPMSFIPLFASIPSKEQAEKMVKTLTDKTLLYTEFPFSTISLKDESYSTDMWRGGAWINLNYFIVKGLLNYGYAELANEIIEKTLDGIYKWYRETGVIYEFYDSKNQVAPIMCDRKGKQGEVPDYRKHMHSISDFNWSSCFTLMFIQNDLY